MTPEKIKELEKSLGRGLCASEVDGLINLSTWQGFYTALADIESRQKEWEGL